MTTRYRVINCSDDCLTCSSKHAGNIAMLLSDTTKRKANYIVVKSDDTGNRVVPLYDGQNYKAMLEQLVLS